MKAHSGEEVGRNAGVWATSKQSLEDQLTQLNKALGKRRRTWRNARRRWLLGDVLAEAEKSLALVEASQDAIRSSCDQVFPQHEASVKPFAEKIEGVSKE